MNLIETAELNQDMNILSLFNRTFEETVNEDSSVDEEVIEEVMSPNEAPKRLLVSESMLPEQSLYVLEEQLKNLRSNLNRIKFYMGDINDLIPH